MTGRTAFCLALVLASCATSRTATVPEPRPAPVQPPPAPAPATPAVPSATPDTAPSPVSDSVAVDSLVQTAQERDSALDQAMLDRLAAARRSSIPRPEAHTP